MDGETNGSQESTQNSQEQEQGQQQAQGQQTASLQVEQGNENGNEAALDYEKQIAEHDEKIVSLGTQIADAAKSAEQAQKLSDEIAELKKASAEERVDFAQQLTGCLNVKAD